MARISIDSIVQGQLPSFVQEDYQTFVLFLEYYYKFLQDGNGVEVKPAIGTVEGIRDTDSSIDNYVAYLKSELAPKVPLGESDGFKLQRMRDLYDSKGSTSSVKLLMRMLYGKEVDISFPGKQMLIPSDGKWNRPTSIFVKLNPNGLTFPISELIDKRLTIINASGISNKVFVEKVDSVTIKATDGTLSVSPDTYQLSIDNSFHRTFYPGDIVTYRLDGNYFSGVIVAGINSVSKVSSGTGFKLGEIYSIQNTNGFGVLIKITSVTSTGGINTFDFIASGINYNATDISINISPKSYTFPDFIPYSISETGAASPNQTFNAAFNDVTNPIIDSGTLSFFNYVDSSYVDNTYVGEIKSTFYDIGAATAASSGYTANLRLTSNALVQLAGSFVDNSGFLSDSIYLQDSFLYQNFSYVVKVDKRLSEYGGVLKSLVHPSGVNLFGESQLKTEADINISVESSMSGALYISDSVVTSESYGST